MFWKGREGPAADRHHLNLDSAHDLAQHPPPPSAFKPVFAAQFQWVSQSSLQPPISIHRGSPLRSAAMPMDAKEVELKAKALTKAATGGDHSSTITSLLEELRRGVQASEDLLRSTRIGVIVNKLKQHKDPAVAKQAGEVVSKWRTDIKKAGGSGVSTPKAVANGTSSPAPSPVPSKKAKHSVPPEKRNAKEDKVNTALTGNQVRDNCLKLMYDGLAFMSEERMFSLFLRSPCALAKNMSQCPTKSSGSPATSSSQHSTNTSPKHPTPTSRKCAPSTRTSRTRPTTSSDCMYSWVKLLPHGLSS